MNSLWPWLRAGAAAAAIVLGTGAAAGGALVDAAARAEALAEAGEPVRALEALDEAVAAVWSEAPLTVRRWALVESADGYGIYEPRPEGPFRRGETMRVYVEPVAFAYGGGPELHEIAFDIDLAIEKPGGLILFEGEKFFSVAMTTRNRLREFMMSLAFVMPDLRPDRYRAVFTIRDRHSDEAAELIVPFEVERAP